MRVCKRMLAAYFCEQNSVPGDVDPTQSTRRGRRVSASVCSCTGVCLRLAAMHASVWQDCGAMAEILQWLQADWGVGNVLAGIFGLLPCLEHVHATGTTGMHEHAHAPVCTRKHTHSRAHYTTLFALHPPPPGA